MSCILHLEVVALHTTLESLAFGYSAHIHLLPGFEQIGLDLAANLRNIALMVVQTEFPESATCLDTCLGEMTGQRLVHATGFTLTDSDLHSLVAIAFRRANLRNPVGLYLNDSHRYRKLRRH